MKRLSPRNGITASCLGLLGTVALAVTWWLGTGCTVDYSGILDPPATGETPDDVVPAIQEVTVRFRNMTSDVVNVQFYATNLPLEILPDDLFADEANLVTIGIGLGGSGDLGPFVADQIQFECTDDLSLGTAGGEFRDNETGEVYGDGTVRVLEQGLQFSCGAVILFEYQSTGDGYVTTLKLE